VSDFTDNFLGKDIVIEKAAPLGEEKINQLTFCDAGRELDIKSVGSVIVVITEKGLPKGNTYVINRNPKLEFIRMMKKLYPDFVKPQITLGNNVQIHPSSVIGDEGLGDVRSENGEWVEFPHIGGVRIGNNVRIHALSVIVRGVLCDTVIGEGTVIGNQVQIGHNTRIGKHCLLTPHVEISGGVTVGDYTIIQPGVQIANKVRVGNNVVIGIGSVIIQDIPDNVVVVGVPGKIIRENNDLY